ncbi:hypothetical protein NPIL_604061, partial [Nephila pilipes]
MNHFKAPKYHLRPFVEADIPAIVKIALRSTFQYTIESLVSWSEHDSTGLIVAVLDS